MEAMTNTTIQAKYRVEWGENKGLKASILQSK